MKFSAAALASALLLSTASAAPHLDRREALANRGAKKAYDLSGLYARTVKPQKGAHVGKNKHVGNKLTAGGPGGYAGPTVVDSPIKMITATVVVPNVITPPNAADGDSYLLSTWVGIQGGGDLWQAGMSASVTTGQAAQYSLFWEEANTLPEEPFSDPFTFGAGDTLIMTVVVSGPQSGTATVQNQGTGATATYHNSTLPAVIGQQNGNFIVEDPGLSGGSALFPAWSGAWQFTNCGYSVGNGIIQTLSQSQVSEISQSGNDLTKTTILSSSSFSMTYVGQ